MKLQADQQFTVYITPLTPIHIGCAVDYEPTDTLIHDKHLYHLKDLANWQSADRALLASTLARASDFASIQAAFKTKAAALSPLAPRPVSMPFDSIWSTDKKGKIKTIERTAFNAVTGNPIVPGSALKGVFRTAWLAKLSTAQQGVRFDPKRIEQELLRGSFESDPLRQLKISDTIPSAAPVHTAIVARASRHRYDMSTTSVPDDGQHYAEALLPAQAHALSATISLQSLNGIALPSKMGVAQRLAPLDFAALLDAVNTQTIATLADELNPRRKGGSAAVDLPLAVWWAKHRSRLEALIQAGAALIRIGRHGGAEHLTLAQRREIYQPKNKQITQTPLSITLAKHSPNGTSLAPFGFALLIPCYARAACEPLLDALLAQMPAEQAALTKAQQAHAQHMVHASAQRLQWQQDAQAAQQAAADQAQAAAVQAAAKQAALDKAARQSPQQNAVDELVTQCLALQPLMVQRKGKLFGINDAVFSEFKKRVLQAVDPSWNDTDKKRLADTVKQHLPTLVAGYGDDKDGRKALKKLLEPLNLPTAA